MTTPEDEIIGIRKTEKNSYEEGMLEKLDKIEKKVEEYE